MHKGKTPSSKSLQMLGRLADRAAPATKPFPVLLGKSSTGCWDVACGDSHVVCVKENGMTFTWGKAAKGALGSSSTADVLLPQLVVAQLPVIQCFACANTSILLLKDGRMFSCGSGVTGHSQTKAQHEFVEMNMPEYRSARESDLFPLSITPGKSSMVILFGKREAQVDDMEDDGLDEEDDEELQEAEEQASDVSVHFAELKHALTLKQMCKHDSTLETTLCRLATSIDALENAHAQILEENETLRDKNAAFEKSQSSGSKKRSVKEALSAPPSKKAKTDRDKKSSNTKMRPQQSRGRS